MFITSRIIRHSLHINVAEVKEKSLAEAPYHRDVNWLTTSLIILRKVIITIAICYPSRIFIQKIKINKHKYVSYSTSVTWGSSGSKGVKR